MRLDDPYWYWDREPMMEHQNADGVWAPLIDETTFDPPVTLPPITKQSAYLTVPHELLVDLGDHTCTPECPPVPPPLPAPSRWQRARWALRRAPRWVLGLRIVHKSRMCDDDHYY
jgi:hypothetical protein